MPLYEYHCEKCGREHEIMRKVSERPLKICPACGGKMTKKISATAFQLKGSGWYKDGYSSATPVKKSEGTGSGPSPADPGKSDKKDAKKDTPNKDSKG